MSELFKAGPAGGCGGRDFSDDPHGMYGRIKQVTIRSGAYIDAIQIAYENSLGEIIEQPQHGGNGGGKDTFLLDDDEYIIEISGRFGQFVDSLLIETNKRRSCRYGGNGGGAEYSYRAPDGYGIVGFIGRDGDYIDAIGVIFSKVKK